MKFMLATALFFTSAAVIADPKPFGLEIGKATIADAEKAYNIEKTGTNKYSNGPMYNVPVSQLNYDGLKELTLIFNQKGILTGALATLPKDQFKATHQSLSKKYKVISQQVPFVGNSSAKYIDGSTEIELNAPHLSFDMSMNYLHKELKNAFEAQSKAESAAKKRAQESQL
jgi:hypothetical protein